MYRKIFLREGKRERDCFTATPSEIQTNTYENLTFTLRCKSSEFI